MCLQAFCPHAHTPDEGNCRCPYIHQPQDHIHDRPHGTAQAKPHHSAQTREDRELGNALQENYDGVYDLPITGLMTNKNVEMLEVHLLQMGYELKSDYDILDLTPGPGPKTHIYNGRKYICTTDEIRRIIAVDLARIRVGNLESGEVFVGKNEDFEDFIEQIATELEHQIEEFMV